MVAKKRAVLLSESQHNIDRVYSKEIKEKLSELVDITEVTDKKELLAMEQKDNVSYIFSTWGMPTFTKEEVSELSSLECVFYAAGTVQSFAREFIDSGVKVFSAWAANAVPVAEYTVAQIILANKGFFSSSAIAKTKNHTLAKENSLTFRGNYGQKVGIIGAGMIGKLVIKMLKSYKLEILVFDPFLPDEKAKELGVRKTDLGTIFSECGTISNHLANNDKTVGMLDYSLFCRMPDNAVFINTGRGAQVVEEDLVRALKERPGRFAVLDVTMPEPPVDSHEFYRMENVVLTPHIAGSFGDETHRMAEYMLEEYKLYANGRQTNYEVTRKMLETMA